MANPIVKDVALSYEPTYGASVSGISHRLHVVSTSLNFSTNKSLVEDTTGTMRGFDRMQRINTSVEGDLQFFATPHILHHAFSLVNGTSGVSATFGTSGAIRMIYDQNTSGTYPSASVVLDRETTAEKYVGVVATGLELSGSDNKIEGTLSLIGQGMTLGGISVPYEVGVTLPPFTFADVFITRGTTSSFSSGNTTVRVSEWSVNYTNGNAGVYLSGSRNITRVDPSVPRLEGSFKIFHDNSTYSSASAGVTEYSLRFALAYPPEEGAISGTTVYTVLIDIPRVEVTTTVKDYEIANVAMEEVSFVAVFDYGRSCLWEPQILFGSTADFRGF